LIEAGEASGTLPDVLDEIRKYQESTDRFKRKILSAMVYPIILICFSIVAITIFLVKVIPTFEKVFQGQGRGQKLPEVTQFVLDASRFMSANIGYIFIGMFIFVVTIQIMLRKRRYKRWIDNFMLRVPIVKDFLIEVAIVRFARGLATMIKAGISIIQALDISSRLVGNVVVEDKLGFSLEDVKKGHSLAAPMDKYRIFPPFVSQLIAVGEETGSLDKFLDIIGSFYEERLDATIQRLSSAIEPAIILVMGVVVGTLVISMFLPLIQISTGGVK
jgi:type IV pilus assembly protein PilC